MTWTPVSPPLKRLPMTERLDAFVPRLEAIAMFRPEKTLFSIERSAPDVGDLAAGEDGAGRDPARAAGRLRDEGEAVDRDLGPDAGDEEPGVRLDDRLGGRIGGIARERVDAGLRTEERHVLGHLGEVRIVETGSRPDRPAGRDRVDALLQRLEGVGGGGAVVQRIVAVHRIDEALGRAVAGGRLAAHGERASEERDGDADEAVDEEV
jgi:hypothetical protein